MSSEKVTDICYKMDTRFKEVEQIPEQKKVEAYRYSYPCYSTFTSVNSSFSLSDVDFNV